MTDEELAALKSARAKGARKIKRGDEEVEFRSLADMDRIIQRAESKRAGQPNSIAKLQIGTSRGLG